MNGPSVITRLDVYDWDLPLHVPFGIAGGALSTAENLIVQVELADGTVGHGEAAPFHAYNGETRETTRRALKETAASLCGKDVRQWRRLAQELYEALPKRASARCALETAILDAFTRREKVSFWRYFGAAKRSLRTDLTVPTGDVKTAGEQAVAAVQQGFRTLKIKISNQADDVARIVAIKTAAPDAALILDANASLTPDRALELLADLKQRGIVPALFEQPVDAADLEGMARVQREGSVPVAADESAVTGADVKKIADAGAAQVINIKLMKSGLSEAMNMAWLARESGLKLMIGGLVESPLAMSASAGFAAGTGGFSFIDLDTPLFMKDVRCDGGIAYEKDAIRFTHIKAGHGCVPRLD